MKFKYYLKGLGMGIIFTTIIMTISCVIHNNNLSEQEIIEKAKELGMVMPDTEQESEGGLFGNKNNSESLKESGTEETSDNQNSSAETQEPETAEPIVSQSETTEPESQTPPIHVEVTQYILHIVPGDTPRMIASELYENGVIDSASDFRDYLDDNGYAKKIRTGTYTITIGMTYEEIAKMITKA